MAQKKAPAPKKVVIVVKPKVVLPVEKQNKIRPLKRAVA
jgi:hypothetical protein